MPRGKPLRIIDSGEVFTDLTVLKKTEGKSPSGKMYDCICVCGDETKASARELLAGLKVSCGCTRPDRYRKDIKGQKYGTLTAIKDVRTDKNGSRVWECLCDCGNIVEKNLAGIIRTESPHCGCLFKPKREKKGTYKTHGMSGTSSYYVWANMLSRCYHENRPDFHHYGGRGIGVCDRWDSRKGGSFENFLDDMGEKPEKLSLERVNVNEDYSPENCIWADETTQNYHQRTRKDNSSGVPGVHQGDSGLWIARLWKDKKMIHYSSHIKFEDAVDARKQAELEYYGYEKSR
jgi:hypothetical protein